MMLTNLYFQLVACVVLFIIYTYFIYELGDTFLENSSLKKWQRIPLGALNAFLALGIISLPNITSFIGYSFYIIILILEFYILYRDKIFRILTLTLSYFLNIMCMRAICISISSMATGLSIYELLHDKVVVIATINATLFIINFMCYLVKVFLTKDRAKVILEHNEQLIFMISWVGLASMYLLFINSKVYSIALSYEFVVQNQLAIASTILILFYIILTFSILVGQTAYIKKQNIQLSQTIENQQQFQESVIKDALNVYEINLSKDILISGFEYMPEILEKFQNKYSTMVKILTRKMVYKEDVILFMKYASLENLLVEYYKGKRELELGFRKIEEDGSFLWVKATTNLYVDNLTGDIKALVYIKDIHQEKLIELELKNKAEKDSLTQLYNKGNTEILISEYLSLNMQQSSRGALFIIDVDNFKMINDTFGHTFGDEVLRTLADKLRDIFRTKLDDKNVDGYDDIVGRVGGDEFMIFMKRTIDKDVLIKKAKSICKAFRNTYRSESGVDVTISCSIGISIFPENGIYFEDLYKNADIALYLSKSKGKNNYSFYQGEKFVEYESKRGEIESGINE